MNTRFSIRRNLLYVVVFPGVFSCINMQAMVRRDRTSSNIQVSEGVADVFGGVIKHLQNKIKQALPAFSEENDVRKEYARNWLDRKRVRYPEKHHITLRATASITKSAYDSVKSVLDNVVLSQSVINGITNSNFKIKPQVFFATNDGFPNGWFRKYEPNKYRVVVFLEIEPERPLLDLTNAINNKLALLVDARVYPGVSKDIYEKTGRIKVQNPQQGKIARPGKISPHLTLAIFSSLNKEDVSVIQNRLKVVLESELKNYLLNKIIRPLKINQFSLTKFKEPGVHVYSFPKSQEYKTKPSIVSPKLSVQVKKIELYPLRDATNFLSNDYNAPFIYNGKQYCNVNEAYNELKRVSNDDELMKRLIFAKFLYNPDLQEKLRKYPDSVKIINNSKHPYWGIGVNNKGQNKLGIILQDMIYTAHKRFFRKKYVEKPF